jgi:hypothetical protein
MNPEPRPRFRRLLARVLVGGALLALAWMSWRVIRAVEPLPVFHLSDGSVVRVEGMAWEGHPLRREPELWTRLKRALPPALQRRVGLPQAPVHNLHSTGLTLALTEIAPPTNGSTIPRRPLVLHLSGAGEDPEGDVSLVQASPRVSWFLGFPRACWRQERLRFRLQDGTSWFDFNLPNPRHQEAFPRWEPEPLPAHRTIGDFELLCASRELSPRGPPRVELWPPDGFPSFAVRHAGTNANGWFAWHFDLHDALGVRGAVTPGETVAKVGVRALPGAEFPAALGRVRHRWTVRVPEALEVTELEIPESLAKEGLQRLWISGAGSFQLRPDSLRCTGPLPAEKAQLFPDLYGQGEFDFADSSSVDYRCLVPVVWWRALRPKSDFGATTNGLQAGHWVMQFLANDREEPLDSVIVSRGEYAPGPLNQPQLSSQFHGDSLDLVGARQSIVLQLVEAPILQAEFTVPVPGDLRAPKHLRWNPTPPRPPRIRARPLIAGELDK